MATPMQDSGKTIGDVIDEVGLYPEEAYRFVQDGLGYTQEKMHGRRSPSSKPRHITGRDLCIGLRDLALERWGLMAKPVLARWNVQCTMDFGRIVFALVDGGFLQKTDEDSVEDFREVFDFADAFDRGFRVRVP